jgi:hypothetical protein
MSEIIDKARTIAVLLEIPAPDDSASEDDRRTWVDWWEASYEAARGLTDEQKSTLKAGGWWPPVTAAQIGETPPDIVLRTRRPGLFEPDDDTMKGAREVMRRRRNMLRELAKK